MKIYKALLQFSDVADGIIHSCDTIEHGGRFWLVPDWLEFPAEKVMRPIRIVCFDMYPHQKMIGGQQCDFVLNEPIPKAVLDGKKEGEYLIVENPDIAVPIPSVTH